MVCIIVATKRPFPHKGVRARPFKRYRTAEPNPLVAKPNTYPDTKHTSEITVDDESRPLEEPNSSRKEISESVSTLQMAYYLFLDRQVCKVHCQGSHWDWKTWKSGKAFSSQGKVREF